MQDTNAAALPIAGPMTRAVTVETVVPLEIFTLRYALAVLGAHNNNKSSASRALGITRYALMRLCKRARVLGVA